jgi:hypothetical protein
MKKILLAVVAVALLGSVPYSYAVTDGTPSTGSFTVVSAADLAAAAASGQIEIIPSLGSQRGARLSIGSAYLREGIDWRIGVSSYATATSLASAINTALPNITATVLRHGATIQLTANETGTTYNAYGLLSSTTSVKMSAAYLTGGVNDASIFINYVELKQGRDWYISDTNAKTALEIAAAISRDVRLAPIIEAVPLGAVVYLRSKISPTAYVLRSTGGSALLASGTAMYGGTAGNLARFNCDLGAITTLPTGNYPEGCKVYQTSDHTPYIASENVTSAASWKALPYQSGPMDISNLTMDGNATANYTDSAGAVDGTAFYSYIATMAAAIPSGAEITNLLGRIRWYKGDNSNAILNGFEGVCSSHGADESITCRGASLRTYTTPGATLRSSFGADISARSSYSGGTENVAEAGTAFVGARIWMAPYFTDGSLPNINNFHGLWIYNEAAAKVVTNGIKIESAGGGFTNDINLQNGGLIKNTTTGVITISDAFEMKAKTKAALLADTPVKAGLTWYCSDCSVDGVVISTAATPGGVGNLAIRTQVIQ